MLNALKQFFGSALEDHSPQYKHWNAVDGEEAIKEILMKSNSLPQVIYKHSTRCATSYLALKDLQNLSEEDLEKADFYLVDVIQQRGLSRTIADELGVRHESPQLIVVEEGSVIWHGSHYQVKAQALSDLLQF
ncbi:MAG: bacillithiol system redox-active protein YtxJ [Balneola sp.]|nr:bacillithiol system redox-active protein YtxJ [Balneola sp.]|tara:strand:- start:11439 stop:11837 length:399 start_codon:yes stop_codon:yes gene_type:complete